MASAHTIF